MIILDGKPASITGGLWHAASPSIVWFWPIVVLLASVLAGWRLRRPDLDRRLSRGLGLTAVLSLSVAVAARDLHGRPTVSVFHLIELVLVLSFSLWAVHRLLFAGHGYFTYLVIAMVTLWQGAELIPTLLQGFVLAAGPAFLARASAVLCLGTGIALLLMVFRIADQRDSAAQSYAPEDDGAWELA